MKQLSVDVAVIGGGPAGLAAALSAKAEGPVMIIGGTMSWAAFSACITTVSACTASRQNTGPSMPRFINELDDTDIGAIGDYGFESPLSARSTLSTASRA